MSLLYSIQRTKNDYVVISHSGIPGMHWGIRRYQNPDGTLTPEGRERYGYSDINGYENYYDYYDSETIKEAQRQERKAKIKKILAIAGAVTVAAAIGYVGFKTSTKLRDLMRSEASSKAWNYRQSAIASRNQKLISRQKVNLMRREFSKTGNAKAFTGMNDSIKAARIAGKAARTANRKANYYYRLSNHGSRTHALLNAFLNKGNIRI